MKKLLSLLLVLCMTASLTVAFAEAAPAEAPADNVVPLETETSAPAADETAAPTVTQHTLELDGQTLNYTATAGMMPVTVLDGTCDMFYTAYTLDGVEDMGQRPVTFVFNGGPGSASIWLHIGMLGPRRVEMDEDGQPLGLPSHVTDNPDTLLDLTDLVFIDPVGTGYSQVTGATDPSFFYNTSYDAASVAEFIHQYTTRNGRWGSPKYLVGESYGTVRAVAVANHLANAYYMDLNGLMLISTANDYSLLLDFSPSDLSSVLYLPTYAAIAQYHGMLEEPYASMSLEDLIAEVKGFGEAEYQAALFKGIRLTDDEKDAMAEKIAAFTGLKKDFVRKSNLRISMTDFCTHLLEDRKQVCGRIDGRYTGPATNGNIGNSSADPSMAAVSGMFASALNDYFYNELDYRTDLLYEALNTDVNFNWTFGTDGYSIDQKQDIYTAMSRNRFLKIWVLCGYYDLATPFQCAEWVYDHVFLNEQTRPNLSFTYYPSGHMIYMHQPSLDQFHEDAVAWYQN